MRMLRVFFSVFGECQAPPIGLEYELQRFQSFQWNRVDAHILKTMARKTEWMGPHSGGKSQWVHVLIGVTSSSPLPPFVPVVAGGLTGWTWVAEEWRGPLVKR